MTTLVSDSFNRANSSTLGTTDTGQTWNLVSGAIGISNDQCAPSGTTNVAVIDSGYSDATLALDLYPSGSGNAIGITFRYSDANNYWYAYCYQSGRAVIGYVNAGVNKALAGANVTFSNGTTLQVVLSGSSITVNVGGTQVLTRADTFNDTATQHGLYFSNTGTSADNFSVTTSNGGTTNAEGTASFSGVGSLAATSNLKTENAEGTASFTGSGSLGITADLQTSNVQGSASLKGTATMSSIGGPQSNAVEESSAFTGTAVLSASGDIVSAPNIEGSAEYQGDGTLSANGSVVGNQLEVDAAFSGGRDLAANADVQAAPNVEASAGFQGDDSMSAPAQMRMPVSAVFGGAGTLMANGFVPDEVHIASVSLLGRMQRSVSLQAQMQKQVALISHRQTSISLGGEL